MPTIDPGRELQLYLEREYSRVNDEFLRQVDYDLMADGQLTELFRQSCINYMVRRLITTAEFFRRSYPPTTHGPQRHLRELRDYLGDFTRYSDRTIDDLMRILTRCLIVLDDEITDTQKNRLKRSARETNSDCSVCGGDLSFQGNPASWIAATVDHIWPRSLGGRSEDDNIQVACRACNEQNKKDHIDASDYHFEAISFPVVSYEGYRRDVLNREYEVAVFATTGFTCSVCRVPASRVGRLYVGRKDPADSWHFANLTAYCRHHKPEE